MQKRDSYYLKVGILKDCILFEADKKGLQYLLFLFVRFVKDFLKHNDLDEEFIFAEYHFSDDSYNLFLAYYGDYEDIDSTIDVDSLVNNGFSVLEDQSILAEFNEQNKAVDINADINGFLNIISNIKMLIENYGKQDTYRIGNIIFKMID